MNSRLKIFISIICLALFSALPAALHAQMPTVSLDGVNTEIEPEAPAPGESVTITLVSFNTDLNAASIVWLVDGKNLTSGIGKKSIVILAPQLGKITNVQAVIMTVEGKEVRKVIPVSSGGVDLVWESKGFVPPFFKGKAPFAYQNPVAVTAIPHLAGPNGVELDPKSLLYTWKVNSKGVPDQSGYGKQTLLIKDDLPKSSEIELVVTSRVGSLKAASTLTLSPGDPAVSFYEEDPLYGILYNNAIVDLIRLSNQEITIRAVPYSFNLNTTNPLTYVWSVNNLERNDLSTNQSITLRTKGDTEGQSRIGLEVKSSGNILQAARNAINVEFTKKKEGDTTLFQ